MIIDALYMLIIFFQYYEQNASLIGGCERTHQTALLYGPATWALSVYTWTLLNGAYTSCRNQALMSGGSAKRSCPLPNGDMGAGRGCFGRAIDG